MKIGLLLMVAKVEGFGYATEEVVNGSVTCEDAGMVAIPVAGVMDPIVTPKTSCDAVRAAYEQECCGASEATFEPYWMEGAGDIFAPAGSHLSHAESFSGTKIQALLTTTECKFRNHVIFYF